MSRRGFDGCIGYPGQQRSRIRDIAGAGV